MIKEGFPRGRSWKDFLNLLYVEATGISISQFDAGVRRWLVTIGRRSSPDKTTQSQRRALWVAVQDLRFDWSSGTIRPDEP